MRPRGEDQQPRERAGHRQLRLPQELAPDHFPDSRLGHPEQETRQKQIFLKLFNLIHKMLNLIIVMIN